MYAIPIQELSDFYFPKFQTNLTSKFLIEQINLQVLNNRKNEFSNVKMFEIDLTKIFDRLKHNSDRFLMPTVYRLKGEKLKSYRADKLL